MSRARHPLTRALVGALTAVAVVVAGTVAAGPAYAAAPTVTAFTPTSGPVGTSVKITGTGFAAPARVTFGGVAATSVKVVSPTAITTQVPAAAMTGKIVVTVGGVAGTSANPFTVTPLAKLSTSSGPPTSATKVTLSGFTPFEAVDVYLDTTAVALASAGRTGAATATVTFAATITPGTHWITAVGRTSGSSAQASYRVTTAWSQFGFDSAKQFANPYETTISTGTVGGLEQVWRKGPGLSAVSDGPTVANGLVYCGFRDNTVRAFDAVTGTQKWSVATNYESDVTVGTSLVYIAAGDTMIALSATTGAVKWAVTLPDNTALTPVLSGTTLYVPTGDGLGAYDATTGALRWSKTWPSSLSERLAIQGDLLVLAFSDGTIRGLDPADGTQLWVTSVGAFVYGVTLANGLAFVTYGGPDVVALDVEDGTVVWTTALSGLPTEASYARGIVYVGTSAGNVYALNATTGGLQWSTTLTGSPYISAPAAVANGVLYVPTRGGLRALAAAYGSVLWSTNDQSYYNSVAVSDGSVFVAVVNSRVVRYALPNTTTAGVARPDARTLRR